MKKLFSTKYTPGAFNAAVFIFRVVIGLLMMSHGYDKLTHFADKQVHFMNFLGMGSTLSLALVVFAEFFCALFIVLGLFTRLSTIPLIICMAVAFFKVHHAELKDGELSLFFLAGYVLLALVGPGKISVDGFSGK